MIIERLLAWAGLCAAPPFSGMSPPDLHNDTVHKALNVKAAVLAGHARLLRLQKVGDRVAVNGNAHVAAAIAEKQNEIRAGLDDLARRFD